jgi:hypothetical protein
MQGHPKMDAKLTPAISPNRGAAGRPSRLGFTAPWLKAGRAAASSDSLPARRLTWDGFATASASQLLTKPRRHNLLVTASALWQLAFAIDD